jgi:probable F420-dependent oxidoreductase
LPAQLQEYLARAEELGFEGGWTMEQAIGETPLLAPLELLAYCAACTKQLRLGVAVMVTSRHDPLQLAAAVTAVDRLSDGRLDLGVAPGGRQHQFSAFGVNAATFVGRFTEGLKLMKAAWSNQPRVTFRGRFHRVDDVPIQPKPVQRPHPPIWFGGHVPAALARATRHGDGFLSSGSTSTAAFAKEVSTLREELGKRNRDPADFQIGKRVYVMVDDRDARAQKRALTGIRRIYGDRMRDADSVAVWGTPDRVVRELRPVVDAGADMLLLNPVGNSIGEDAEQMERLAADVIPKLA